jgi:hypothetical protein
MADPDRLVIDPALGVNRYGCFPHVCPDVLPLGSCTASSPDPLAWAAASAMREALAYSIRIDGWAAVEAAAKAIRQDLLATLHLTDSPPQVALAPSGTDAEYLALSLVLGLDDDDLCVLIIGPGEIGNGSPKAAAGRHVSTTPPWAPVPVPPNALIAGLRTDGGFGDLTTLRHLHAWLYRDCSGLVPAVAQADRQALASRYHVGQPIILGTAGDTPIVGLRLALGAPLVLRLATDTTIGGNLQDRLGWLDNQLQALHRKIDVLVRHGLPVPPGTPASLDWATT